MSHKTTFTTGIALKEMATPSALSGYVPLYAKTDGKLHGLIGGAEEELAVVDRYYGEAFIYNNANPTEIETVDSVIALRQISEGLTDGFTFDAGSTGAITSYQDGTVPTTHTRVNDVAHGLSNNDIITIRGSSVAAYNGVQTVSSVSTDYFDIDTAWDVDGGASDWDQGASLTADVGAAGIYSAAWQMSTAPDAAANLTFMMYINTTPQTKSTAERKFPINDLGSTSSSCVLSITDGDLIWLSVQSDNSSDITNKHGEYNIRRL